MYHFLCNKINSPLPSFWEAWQFHISSLMSPDSWCMYVFFWRCEVNAQTCSFPPSFGRKRCSLTPLRKGFEWLTLKAWPRRPIKMGKQAVNSAKIVLDPKRNIWWSGLFLVFLEDFGRNQRMWVSIHFNPFETPFHRLAWWKVFQHCKCLTCFLAISTGEDILSINSRFEMATSEPEAFSKTPKNTVDEPRATLEDWDGPCVHRNGIYIYTWKANWWIFPIFRATGQQIWGVSSCKKEPIETLSRQCAQNDWPILAYKME